MQIFTEIDYFSYITSLFKWIFIFLTISIFLLVFCHKKGLFRRNNKVVNVLTFIYYIGIPLHFIVFAVQFAPIRNTQNQINEIIENNKTEICEFAGSFLESFDIEESTKNLSMQQAVDDEINKFLDQMETDNAEGAVEEKSFWGDIKRKITFKFLSKVVEKGIISETTEKSGLKKSSGKKVYKSSLHDLFTKGEIVEIFQTELNKIFYKLYFSLFLAFLIGLLIPTIETSLAKYFKY